MKIANGGIVRTISRTLNTWNQFKDYKFELSEEFLASLISKQDTKDIERAAKKEHRFNMDIDNEVEIFKLGFNYWNRVYTEINKEGILSYGDISFLKNVAEYAKKYKLLSKAQCKRLGRIIEKAEDKGYIMPEKPEEHK